MKDKIFYREFQDSGLCTAVNIGSDFYYLYGKEDTFIGEVKKEFDYFKYFPSRPNSIENNLKFVCYVLNSLNSCIKIPNKSYVYVVYVDKNLKYIGKGVGSRFTHAVSGTSHVYELNMAYFTGGVIEVFCYADGMTDDLACSLESGLIREFGCIDSKNLYNSKGLNKDSDARGGSCEVELYKSLKKRGSLIAAKVGDTEQYEEAEDFYENLKWPFFNKQASRVT